MELLIMKNTIKNTAVIGLWIAAIAIVVTGFPVVAGADAPLYHFDNWGTYTFTNGVDTVEVLFNNGDVDVFTDSTWFRIGGGRMLRVIDAQNGVFAFDWTDNGWTLVNTDVPEVVENETEEPEVEPVVVIENTTSTNDIVLPVTINNTVATNDTTTIVDTDCNSVHMQVTGINTLPILLCIVLLIAVLGFDRYYSKRDD